MDEDGPGWGHPCHLDTFLVCLFFNKLSISLLKVFDKLDISKLQSIQICFKNGHVLTRAGKGLTNVMLWTLLLLALVIRYRDPGQTIAIILHYVK